MAGPKAGTPNVGETLRVGRSHLTIVAVEPDALRLEDAKGKRSTIRLDPGVRFDWDTDHDAWVPHE